MSVRGLDSKDLRAAINRAKGLKCHQEQEQNCGQQYEKLPGTIHVVLKEVCEFNIPSAIVMLVNIFNHFIQERNFGQSDRFAHPIPQVCSLFVILQMVPYNAPSC